MGVLLAVLSLIGQDLWILIKLKGGLLQHWDA